MTKEILKSLDVDVINFILHNNDATIDELCSCFNVSAVSIRSALSKIESFFIDNNIGKLLKKNGQYSFEINMKNINFNYEKISVKELEKKERIVYIVFKLITENFISLTSISNELNVSRITINSDLKIVKELISDFNLKLVSVQWKGVFLEGELIKKGKFAVLFLAKLYIENYFNSPLKNIINPVLVNSFKKEVPEDIEKRCWNLANKIYQYFGIELGTYHYYILISILIYIYICRKNGYEFFSDFENLSSKLRNELDSILENSDKELIGEKYEPIVFYLENCIQKKYSIPLSPNVNDAVEEIYTFLQEENNTSSFDILSFFVNNLYFESHFSIPTYIKFVEEDRKIIESEICKKIIKILAKNKIPYKKSHLAFLCNYLYSNSNEFKKKNVLIIDSSTLNWKAKKLKEKLINCEKIAIVDIVLYFNFKLFSMNRYEKYDTFIFIDLANEKKFNYSNKEVYFINSYGLLKNSINFEKLFSEE